MKLNDSTQIIGTNMGRNMGLKLYDAREKRNVSRARRDTFIGIRRLNFSSSHSEPS